MQRLREAKLVSRYSVYDVLQELRRLERSLGLMVGISAGLIDEFRTKYTPASEETLPSPLSTSLPLSITYLSPDSHRQTP